MPYISWSIDFALYLQLCQIGRHQTLDILVKSDTVNDLIILVWHCDLYFMVQ